VFVWPGRHCAETILSALWLLGLAGLLPGCRPAVKYPPLTATGAPPDTIFLARVVTLEPDTPLAEAVAVRNGRIVYVGDRDGATRALGDSAFVVDWSSHTLYPGFTDSHGHLAGLGRALFALDLRGTRSKQELLARLTGATAGSGWLLGRGWDQNGWPDKSMPIAQDIDSVVSDRPVALVRIDGHALVANTTALGAADITAETPDPAGGRIERDPTTGAPTGLLIDTAMSLVESVLPQPRADEIERHLLAAVEHLLPMGITEVHDAGTSVAAYSALERLARSRRLKLRVYAMFDANDETGRLLMQREPTVGSFGGRLSARAIKLLADGALGSRGAWLTEPYADAPKQSGLAVTPQHELMAVAREAHERGYQIAVHAIGDAANRTVLHVFEVVFARALRRGASASRRGGIEHAQVFDPEDYRRAASMGVIASIQPSQAVSDMGWTEARLGPRRTRWTHAWRSLADGGVRLALGSDFPVEDASPLLGIHAAATRTDPSGFPPGGWLPAQRLTLEEALRGYTEGAAFAAFEEDLRGTIRVGKLADFTVLDRDLLQHAPEDVTKTQVVATVVGGEVVWSR